MWRGSWEVPHSGGRKPSLCAPHSCFVRVKCDPLSAAGAARGVPSALDAAVRALPGTRHRDGYAVVVMVLKGNCRLGLEVFFLFLPSPPPYNCCFNRVASKRIRLHQTENIIYGIFENSVVF